MIIHSGIIIAMIHAMNQTTDMATKIAAPDAQNQREVHEQHRLGETAEPATAVCNCLSCKGGIEFELSGFQERICTNLLIFGQIIKCPHCGATTSIYISDRLYKRI